MKFLAYHGVSPQETIVGNDFTVDVAYAFSAEKAIASDDLQHTVNYAEVFDLVKKEMAQPSRLLEHVAGRILRAIKEACPQLTSLEVRVSKHHPPLGGEVDAASVSISEQWLV